MKTKYILAAALLGLPALHAQILEPAQSFSPNLAIPDGNATGVFDSRTITSAITGIESITVTLNITGDYNGDLYLYLRHDSGFSVLLNRPGRDTGNLFGYADRGFNITLRDDAANDLHNYRNFSNPAGGSLAGSWKPDGRKTDPSTVLAGGAATALLSSFA
ncbi:MAG TPA: hypothetical protein VK633_10725, partial [Verrucomicrobiae bacterium]|nr:hypothetical protein [Verrucomicrobiae bacterium]